MSSRGLSMHVRRFGKYCHLYISLDKTTAIGGRGTDFLNGCATFTVSTAIPYERQRVANCTRL